MYGIMARVFVLIISGVVALTLVIPTNRYWFINYFNRLRPNSRCLQNLGGGDITAKSFGASQT